MYLLVYYKSSRVTKNEYGYWLASLGWRACFRRRFSIRRQDRILPSLSIRWHGQNSSAPAIRSRESQTWWKRIQLISNIFCDKFNDLSLFCQSAGFLPTCFLFFFCFLQFSGRFKCISLPRHSMQLRRIPKTGKGPAACKYIRACGAFTQKQLFSLCWLLFTRRSLFWLCRAGTLTNPLLFFILFLHFFTAVFYLVF